MFHVAVYHNHQTTIPENHRIIEKTMISITGIQKDTLTYTLKFVRNINNPFTHMMDHGLSGNTN